MSLKRVASENLAICESGQYVSPSGRTVDLRAAVDAAVSGTLLHPPDSLDGVSVTGAHKTRFEVTDESTAEAGHRLVVDEGVADVAALSFASARNPGGGFLNGAKSQEEDLARASALYACLITQWTYYEANRAEQSFAYTDHLIYSPGVPFFRNEHGRLLEAPWTMALLTAPAPNAGEAKRHGESDAAVLAALDRRAELALRAFAAHGHRTLVLGAWGCGVFRNDPREVAAAFKRALRGPLRGAFERVVFAVYQRQKNGPNRRAFEEAFGRG